MIRRWSLGTKTDGPLTGNINALEGESALGRELGDPSQCALQQSGDLDGRSVSRRSRETLVTSLVRRSHLVLPSTTVVSVTTKDDTSLPVNVDLLVESLVLHVHVQVRSSIVLSEFDTLGVSLKNLLNKLGDSARVSVGTLVKNRRQGIFA
jgi:hypothetical protein